MSVVAAISRDLHQLHQGRRTDMDGKPRHGFFRVRNGVRRVTAVPASVGGGLGGQVWMNNLGMMFDCWWPGENGGMSELGLSRRHPQSGKYIPC